VEPAVEKPRAAKPAGRVDRTIIVQPGQALHVQLEQGEPVRITRERFIMGRGSHCDLVVKSAKVSREHAAVVREGAEYFIEDLRSSNGTWFQDSRINRRHVSDGDEYLLGGIPVIFSLR
jgi:pSer/pThr/pTyr-binding forkhead associated (FHA) protein